MPFDSLHTIEFTKLLRRFDNKAITVDKLDSNLPSRPEWAFSTVQLQDRITNQASLNLVLQGLIEKTQKEC